MDGLVADANGRTATFECREEALQVHRIGVAAPFNARPHDGTIVPPSYTGDATESSSFCNELSRARANTMR
jgi:hypothetical protein